MSSNSDDMIELFGNHTTVKSYMCSKKELFGMKKAMLVWASLSVASILSIYTYSIVLLSLSILFVSLYSSFLWTIKKYRRGYVKYFFVAIFIALIGFLLYGSKQNDCAVANFPLGMLSALVVLVPFHALPFIDKWTSGGALLRFEKRDLGIHHWFLGSLVMLISALLPLLASFPPVSCFGWLWEPEAIAFFLGVGFFLWASQVPEVMLSRKPFSIVLEVDR